MSGRHDPHFTYVFIKYTFMNYFSSYVDRIYPIAHEIKDTTETEIPRISPKIWQ